MRSTVSGSCTAMARAWLRIIQRRFRMAGDQGNAQAQYNLGVMYSNGKGVAQNDSAARKWWRMAADQGDTQAQYNLGSCTPMARAWLRIIQRR